MAEQKHTFNIENIYLNQSEFSSPHPFHRTDKEWRPNANLKLDITSNQHDDQFDVAIHITVDVTMDKEQVFKVFVNQGGTFTIKGYTDEEVGHLTESFCASILYPYARQKISDMITSAGFPPLHLSPIDFETRYRQIQANQKSTESSK